jgi:hypothetical protein
METYIPSEFMFVAEKGLIIIVPNPPSHVWPFWL